MPQAQSADGVIHDFPEGTDPGIMDRVMKQYATSNPQAKPPSSFGETMWQGLTTLPRMAQGVVEGVSGEGVPAGRASQFEGGPARFAGRAIGAGARSMGESLWEGLIKAPGKMVTGEMQPGPEAEAAARSMAMGMAGQGGFAPGRALPGLAERPPRLTLGGGQPPAGPVGPVGGSMRLATVQMPSGPLRTVQSPPLTREQMPLGAPSDAPVEAAPPIRPPLPSTPARDAATVNLYRQAVLPRMGRRSRDTQVKGYEDAVTTGIDEIIGNQPNLRLTAPNGIPLPPGSTVPQNMKQFSEGIDQSKTTLFEQWNPMTQKAGEAGLRIDLAPVASELRSLAGKPEVALVNPGVVSQLEKFADLYEGQGLVSPLEAQKMVQGINLRLKAFYEKGEAASGAPAEVLEPVARMLRKQLDEGIEGAVGPSWQELRDKYGALSSIEKDVTKAVERLANRPSGTLGKIGNFLSSREFAHSLLTLNPAGMARAMGTKGAVELHKLLNDPNRMIEQMFKQRMAPTRAAAPAMLNPASRGLQGAMSYGLAQPPHSGGFPQPKRDPDQPLRQPVF